MSTMTSRRTNTQPAPDFAQYRGYLQLLATLQLPLYTQRRFDASDVVQQTLLDAHRDWGAFAGDQPQQVHAWLRTILSNNVLSRLQYEHAQKRDIRSEHAVAAALDQSSVCLERFLAADQTSVSQRLQRDERYEKLAAALAELPDDQRQAVLLKHFHDKSLVEVAEAMGKSLPAIGGLLKRGMAALRQRMTSE